MVAWFIPFIAGLASSAITTTILAPAGERLYQWGRAKFTPTQLSPDAVALLRVRKRISDAAYKAVMRANGYDERKADLYLQTFERLADVETLVRLCIRKEIDETQYYGYMEKLGYNREQAEMILKSFMFYPDVGDFIRFAVRKVFDQEKVQRYRMDEEFPEPIVPYAQKAGVSPEILKWYWRSHWELPDLNTVLEMVQRLSPVVLDARLPDGTKYGDKFRELGIDPEKLKTTVEDLKDYLAMTGISPFWREKITAILYPSITRIDLRRIWEMGLISEEELYARLLELGYTPSDARKMVEFYKAYALQHEKDLTLSQVRKLWEIGDIVDEDAINYLIRLGYDETEAKAVLNIWRFEVEEKELRDKIDTIVDLCKAGIWSFDDAVAELDKMDIKEPYKTRILARITREMTRAMKQPTREDLTRWLKRGFIDANTFKVRMKQLGYRENDIELYLKEALSST